MLVTDTRCTSTLGVAGGRLGAFLKRLPQLEVGRGDGGEVVFLFLGF